MSINGHTQTKAKTERGEEAVHVLVFQFLQAKFVKHLAIWCVCSQVGAGCKPSWPSSKLVDHDKQSSLFGLFCQGEDDIPESRKSEGDSSEKPRKIEKGFLSH